MSTKSKGTEYEKYIEKICKSINSYSNFNLIELKQDKKIIGLSGVEHPRGRRPCLPELYTTQSL